VKCQLNGDTNLFIILVLLKKVMTLLGIFLTKNFHRDEITSTTTGFLGASHFFPMKLTMGDNGVASFFLTRFTRRPAPGTHPKTTVW